jgi:hypothetical protein
MYIIECSTGSLQYKSCRQNLAISCLLGYTAIQSGRCARTFRRNYCLHSGWKNNGNIPEEVNKHTDIEPGSDLRQGKPTVPYYWPVTNVGLFLLKMFGLKFSHILCLEIKHLFSVLLCVIRSVYKFDFRPIKKTRSYSDRDSYFWQAVHIFPRPTSRVWEDFPTLGRWTVFFIRHVKS